MSELARLVYSDDFLCHYQVKGAKWGVRRWQYPDGSLTPEGRIHYGIGPARDKDPDLVDPYSKANIAEELTEIRTRGVAAEARLMDSVKPAFDKKRFFESETHYKKRKDEAWREYEQAQRDVEPYRKEENDALRKHQNRFELYVNTMDDIDYLLKYGADLSEADRKDIEAEYKELERAVDRYINADMGYDPEDTSGRREVLYQAYKALDNAKLPKDTAKFAAGLSSIRSRSSDASSSTRKILDSIDIMPLVKKYQARSPSGDREAEAIAMKIAKELLGSNASVIADREYNGSAAKVVSKYLTEKAMTEAYKDDPDVLDNLWRTNDYYPDTGKALDDWEKRNGQKWR